MVQTKTLHIGIYLHNIMTNTIESYWKPGSFPLKGDFVFHKFENAVTS